MPQFGQPQNQQYYGGAADPASKKKLFMMIGGGVVLIIALILVFSSGGAKPGQETMRKSLQSTSEALGIIDEYENDLQYEPTKNDVALMQILLRGNFQKLNELYNKTYKPKKKFNSTPKIDTKSKTALDASERNNTIDSDLLKALEPKIASAKKNLSLTRSSFKKKDSVEKIKVSIEDLGSIQDILNRDR